MKQIKTVEQVANIFTKSLDNMKFIRFREALGMIERENKVFSYKYSTPIPLFNVSNLFLFYLQTEEVS
ncbi:hypothetical protein RDI58_022823 [Solanum bulbocastanum]|uniref:Uncharacterized protein n=1 Tax=Solanum bulbocastanum TaxID=147425 RepID=A0AAN8Y614_SOLBU